MWDMLKRLNNVPVVWLWSTSCCCQITGRASVSRRSCRRCASSRPLTETPSPSLSAAVMRVEDGGRCVSCVLCQAPYSTRGCVRSARDTPLTAEVRGHTTQHWMSSDRFDQSLSVKSLLLLDQCNHVQRLNSVFYHFNVFIK